MIIEIEKEYSETIGQIENLVKSKNCRPDILYGDLYTVIAVEGDATQLDADFIQTFPGVVRAWRISSPYKTIARRVIGTSHQKIERNRLEIAVRGKDGVDRVFRDGNSVFIAGPCAVESYDQTARIADGLAKLAERHGIRDRMVLRGGAFKPRTRPYEFRGLGWKALDILDRVRDAVGFPYCTEVMAVSQVDEMAQRADMLQIGTRNFQNFDLLEAVGKTRKPVLYKRGVSAELDEWLSAAEYIALSGNKNIVLCERGVKSTVHGDYNRSHIDLDVIPAVKTRTILPIVIDPSHSSGSAEIVPFQFCGAAVYGSNGTLVEVIADDTDRKTIRCDARQGVRMSVYEKMIRFQLAVESLDMRFDASPEYETRFRP
jgi:3-deoxy-7-phosphoheptulonate synthase